MNYGSLRQDARRLSEQGRFGDSMMMHVNPIEVAALDSMVPGGLTRNPATGQPEAWLPLLGLALGATVGGATAKKRDQSLLEGILTGGILGVLGGAGAGALAGGAGAAGAAGTTAAAGTAGGGGTALSSTAAAKAAAAKAAAAKAAAAKSTAIGVSAPNVSLPTAGELITQGVIAPTTSTAPTASMGLPAMPLPPAQAATTPLNITLPNAGEMMAQGLAPTAPTATPMGLPTAPSAISDLSKMPHMVGRSIPHRGYSASEMGAGVGELLQGRGGEAFMKGAGDTLKGYGGNIKEGLGWMADNPMMTMGGAMMLDQMMNEDDEEEYGEYDGPLAYGSWRHGGAS